MKKFIMVVFIGILFCIYGVAQSTECNEEVAVMYSYWEENVAYNRVEIINATDLSRTLIANDGIGRYPFAWSPNGQLLLYGCIPNQLCIWNSHTQLIDRLDLPDQIFIYAVWSPSSSQILLESPSSEFPSYVYGTEVETNAEIYSIDILPSGKFKGETLTNLTQNTADDISPSWSPDGQLILFASNRNATYDIYSMDINGENIQNFTNSPFVNEYSPKWSPNGQAIAYAQDDYSNRYSSTSISIINLNNPYDRRLNTGRNAYNGVWMPDGNQIAFQSITWTICFFDLNLIQRQCFGPNVAAQSNLAISPSGRYFTRGHSRGDAGRFTQINAIDEFKARPFEGGIDIGTGGASAWKPSNCIG